MLGTGHAHEVVLNKATDLTRERPVIIRIAASSVFKFNFVSGDVPLERLHGYNIASSTVRNFKSVGYRQFSCL